ncbi:MAG: hypothetical protein A2Y82_04755 [Candidatus Buchananbacteria bacterium RBG_13_36_9]|uniref:Uncharacterized protein n=1 Tax=Candidatus Buchananbacteria bacterium RBG_13_36_9 TaxID=1797530 RepID=A0A1G1XR33_9BACT|nr:MAG: hypothetical protein A2Y82_04755 [Candidatus Buchananbacteria bacterium RBG_13_36_9]
MAEKSIGSLAQKYAQILMGFLSEAIIKFQTQKAKKQTEVNVLIVSPGFQSVINRIQDVFGDLNLEQEETEQYDSPVISWQELKIRFTDYLRLQQIHLEPQIFQVVMKDLLRLGILNTGIKQKDPQKNPLYAINTHFFEKQEMEKSCLNLKEALDGKFQKAIKNQVAREILLTLAFTASISEEELKYLPVQYCRGIFFQRFGRGILLAMLRGRGVKYSPFMKTVDLLVLNNILIEGCNEYNNEFIILNPSLKPFSVIRELIHAFERSQQETNIIEVETTDQDSSPLGSMVNMTSWGGEARDIYLFEDFEFGLEGL